MITMAYWKGRISILILCYLWNLCEAENICELPNEYMFCTCDTSEPHEETEKINCFVFGNITADENIWDYFRWKSNLMDLTINSRTGSELKFVPSEVLQLLEKLKTITFRQSKFGILEPFTFSKLVSVTSMNLGSNEITELQEKCFYRMQNLMQIELGENSIRRIPANAFVDLPSLQQLYLERNSISRLEANAFQNLHNLSDLDLHMNSIRKLERGSFHGLVNLVRLDLFKNRIEMLKAGVFSSLPNLIELDLSENVISKIEADAFKGLNSLITLRLKSNKITQLPSGLFVGLPLLMHADLSDNKIERVRSSTIQELNSKYEEQFVISFEDNNIICDCDLWWWVSEFLNTSRSPEWRKQLRNVKCKFSENEKTHHRIITLTASKIGCPDMRTTEVFGSPAVLLVNEMTSSESTAPQIDNSQKQPALSDESIHTEESENDASAGYQMKQDSLATKGSVEVQQSSHKRDTGSAHHMGADAILTTITVCLAFLQISQLY